MAQLPKTEFCLLEIKEKVLLVTINRPKSLNALHPMASTELGRVWDFFEANPSLYVAIVLEVREEIRLSCPVPRSSVPCPRQITGKGRLFCAGFDLQWFNENPNYALAGGQINEGFGGLSHRRLKKPVIAAVNGPAFGGGFELALACDLVVASNSSTFALSEPAVGLAALGGGLVRLPHLVGSQRAHEVVLTAQPIDAERALSWGIVNAVTAPEELMATALAYANKIARNSPDSIIASKAIMNLSMDKVWLPSPHLNPLISSNLGFLGALSCHVCTLPKGIWEGLTKQDQLKETKGLLDGENRFEGIKAFNEKRRPQWKPSKL